MVQLLRAEVTRLRWRRAVVALMVLAIVVPGIILAGLLWETRTITEEDRAEAAAEIAALTEQELADCLARPRAWGVRGKELTEAQVAARCERRTGGYGTVDDWIYRPPLTVRETREGGGLAVATVLALLAALLGTTYAGHDWATGSMGNQLLFESRRWRVWAAKFGAVVLATAAMAAVALALFWGGIWAATAVRDITVAEGQWGWSVTAALRTVVLVAGAGGGAYALTMLLRSTVGALGTLIGAGIGSSLLVASLLADGGGRWMVTHNVSAFVLGEFRYYVNSEECWRGGSCEALLTGPQGAAYLGVLVLVVSLASLASFQRRDVP